MNLPLSDNNPIIPAMSDNRAYTVISDSFKINYLVLTWEPANSVGLASHVVGSKVIWGGRRLRGFRRVSGGWRKWEIHTE